ncbi:hypothetical protein SteCoe_16592 [Stentor coeruleus]|uniref:Uncharacterized protein n=1 Tax=Stentor coeruleus TaxID=5963 RepID=A0A1R2C0X0_9CILI|nr:hypothetical protein SteCoe_16592 [Stentor coeruleus]
MHSTSYHGQKHSNSRHYPEETPYKRSNYPARSISPRLPQRYDSKNKRPPQKNYNKSPIKYNNKETPEDELCSISTSPSRNNSQSFYKKHEDYKKNANKKIRCDFPQDLLKEFGFLDSPVAKDKEETVRTLLDPSSGKNEVDEILAAITTNEE